jgi:CCR4-NOT transcriptional regulation complex NOT5 subunit
MARPSALSNLSNSEILREVARRERKARTLARKRDKLMQKVALLDAQIEQYGGIAGRGGRAGVSGRRRRASNSMSLVEALTKALTNKTMGVTEVAEAVKSAGYSTTSPNFRTIVNQALLSNKDAFKRVERGQYTAK